MADSIRCMVTITEHHCERLYATLKRLPPSARASRLRMLAIVGAAALSGDLQAVAKPPVIDAPSQDTEEGDESTEDAVAIRALQGVDLTLR